MGSGLDQLVTQDLSLPKGFKNIADLKLSDYSYSPKKMQVHELVSNSIESRAKIYSWLIYNKTSVDPFLAKARAIKKFYPDDKQDLNELKYLKIEGIKSLKVIDNYIRKFIDK